MDNDILKPLNILKDIYGFNINCVRGILTAAESVNDMSISKVKGRLEELVDKNLLPDLKSPAEIKMTYKYLVQNLIQCNYKKLDTTIEQCIDNAHRQATNFINLYPWTFTCDIPTDSDGECKPHRKKHKRTKLQLAEELLLKHPNKSRDEMFEVFMKELDMSKAGARTYYRTLQKQKENDYDVK